MKKQKSIIIKNPRIQRFRNNLRLLIRLAVYDEVDILRDEIRKLDHIGKYKNKKKKVYYGQTYINLYAIVESVKSMITI